ncbi:MAG: AMP-binding protein [Rhizobiales bacterium]|nr:AMP-binding protein [Hyphomicrobiales bacterium]
MKDLGASFFASVERQPEALAIVDGDVRLSYAEWQDKILRLVQGLRDIGLEHGDHLVVALRNRWEMATLHWACQISGIIVTPVNWRAKAGEIDFYLENSEGRALVFEPVTAEAVAGSKQATDIPRIAIGGAQGGTTSFETLIQSDPAAMVSACKGEDISLMFYTSGTTGNPKGVPRKHSAERTASIAHIAQNLYCYGERALGVMPLYHTMGVRSLVAMSLINGTFVCLPEFSSEVALGLIEDYAVTNLYLVPTLFHALLSDPKFSAERVKTVRKIGFAGAAMTDGLLAQVNDAFKPDLFVNHYGSSEIYTFTICPDAVGKPGSAGKSGINQQIRVVRLDAKEPDELASVGEEGQIIANLNNEEAFEGYWRRPDADAKGLRSGWYFTGDTGYQDEDGDLFVTGRVDDMIITGGENVSPGDIESVLSLHPCVNDVAIVGLPDEKWGQIVTAFIERSAPVEKDALDAHCKASNLANYKRPRAYVFVTQLPKSPVGKLLRRMLKTGDYEIEI